MPSPIAQPLSPSPREMFKIGHYEARTVGRRAVRTLMECFLVVVFSGDDSPSAPPTAAPPVPIPLVTGGVEGTKYSFRRIAEAWSS